LALEMAASKKISWRQCVYSIKLCAFSEKSIYVPIDVPGRLYDKMPS
jgi:hypothetical protein